MHHDCGPAANIAIPCQSCNDDDPTAAAVRYTPRLDSLVLSPKAAYDAPRSPFAGGVGEDKLVGDL